MFEMHCSKLMSNMTQNCHKSSEVHLALPLELTFRQTLIFDAINIHYLAWGIDRRKGILVGAISFLDSMGSDVLLGVGRCLIDLQDAEEEPIQIIFSNNFMPSNDATIETRSSLRSRRTAAPHQKISSFFNGPSCMLEPSAEGGKYDIRLRSGRHHAAWTPRRT
jgi:hypothetical protein